MNTEEAARAGERVTAALEVSREEVEQDVVVLVVRSAYWRELPARTQRDSTNDMSRALAVLAPFATEHGFEVLAKGEVFRDGDFAPVLDALTEARDRRRQRLDAAQRGRKTA